MASGEKLLSFMAFAGKQVDDDILQFSRATSRTGGIKYTITHFWRSTFL